MTSIISKSENTFFGFDMKHASNKQKINIENIHEYTGGRPKIPR